MISCGIATGFVIKQHEWISAPCMPVVLITAGAERESAADTVRRLDNGTSQTPVS